MSAVRSRKFQLGLMLATAVSMLTWPAPGRAYTPEQEQACSGDAMRLCSADIPDVDRITACMARNKSQLSPPCQVFFRPAPELAGTPGRPLSIKPAAAQKPRKSKKSKADDDDE